MKTFSLPGRRNDGAIPAIGLGTWRMGESAARRKVETAAVRQAIELGYRLIDTAEMYGEGGAETLVGKAVADAIRAGDVTRDELFVVSKVYPHNASRQGTPAACDRSRARLGVDRIDLYLLHWCGQHPLRETVEAMRSLVDAGHIGDWGVSNFDVSDMAELLALDAIGTPPGRSASTNPSNADCAGNQVYFSLTERGAEFDLLPWLQSRGIPMMAYSPIDQGALATSRPLAELAGAVGCSAAQLALAWVLSRPAVVAIPKAVSEPHLRENLAAASLTLAPEHLAALDRLFPPPRAKSPLAMV